MKHLSTVTNSDSDITTQVLDAVAALNDGGVIAYPTEYCFGLGCDPRNEQAVQRVLDIKQRSADQGLILVAANIDQVIDFVSLEVPFRGEIEASWPGPNTWLLPRLPSSPKQISGKHQTIAMRISAHPICQQLCAGFGGPIVSTSANLHGQEPMMSVADIRAEIGSELDFILSANLGGAANASFIRDGVTGATLR